MGIAADDEILVDLVGQDGDAVLFADGAQLFQLLPPPYPAHGIVRGREDQQLGAGGGEMGVQGVEVHGIAAVFVHQIAGEQLAAAAFNGAEEGVIDRLEDGDAVTGSGEGLHQPVQGGHHAGGGAQPVFLHGIAVVGLFPMDKGLVVPVGGLVIAVGTVGRPGGHRLPDTGRSLKVHVGHPKGQQAAFSKAGLGAVPFYAVCAVAVDVDQRFTVHKGLLLNTKRYFLQINNKWLLCPSNSGFSHRRKCSSR